LVYPSAQARDSTLWRSLRELLLRLLIPLPPVQRNLALNLSGLGITYKTGSGDRAGTRIPDMALMTAQHEVVRLYELLRFPGYTVLIFIDSNRVPALRSTLDRLAQFDSEGLRVQIVLNNVLPE
jgi:hypothetical protein